jgi:uncharacterized protein YbjT (DUF2867 family)
MIIMHWRHAKIADMPAFITTKDSFMLKPYAITGASGRTGSAAAKALLDRGLPVRVILRDPAKGDVWHDQGADVAIADLADVDAMTAALSDTSGAYLVSPQQYGRNDLFERAIVIAETVEVAVRRAAVPRVVALSSVGAGEDQGIGWIAMNRSLEQALGRLPIPVAFLRAAYFMENWLPMIQQAMSTGRLPSFLAPRQRAIPMVATTDIGSIAADVLEQEWHAQRVIDLAGPADYSPANVASSLSQQVGRSVDAVAIAEEYWATALDGAGMSNAAFKGFVEMTRGLNSGHIAFGDSVGHERLSGTTSLDQAIATLVAAR